MTRRWQRQDGFSLTEIAVALAVLSLASVAIITMVSGAGQTAGKAAIQARQNGELRNAMATLQASIANADRPMLKIGTVNSKPQGNELIYLRTDDRGVNASGNREVSYLAERIYFKDDDGDGTGDVVLQRKGYPDAASRTADLSKLTDPTATDSVWKSAASKVLVSQAQVSSSRTLFSYYSRAGVAATLDATGVPQNVSLVDINLGRDEDGSASQYQSATLDGTVYLRKIGNSTTTSGPVGC